MLSDKEISLEVGILIASAEGLGGELVVN